MGTIPNASVQISLAVSSEMAYIVSGEALNSTYCSLFYSQQIMHIKLWSANHRKISAVIPADVLYQRL